MVQTHFYGAHTHLVHFYNHKTYIFLATKASFLRDARATFMLCRLVVVVDGDEFLFVTWLYL